MVGAQIRYLIGSEHGWLGGLGFGASAIKLGDRDQWIGWDTDQQRQHLHRVIGMSRFLIRPSVRCHNLASMVLGMTLRSVGQDFEDQYKYRPWLVESFVDSDFFAGTCYQATNWTAVGKTKGRGRQDREHQSAKTVKAIYVYPLQADFRARMGVPEPVGIVALQPGEGLDGHAWASQEFGGAVLGDERLSERPVDSARVQAAQPGQAFSAVAKGDWPATKGYYRFIDQPDDSPTNVASILAPHRARTVQRMKAHATVLCIQDGTDLNFSGPAQCEGLGSIGTNQTGASSAGLHLHSTLVVTTEGLPLGLLDAQFHAPVPRAEDDKRASADIPIEGREDLRLDRRACATVSPWPARSRTRKWFASWTARPTSSNSSMSSATSPASSCWYAPSTTARPTPISRCSRRSGKALSEANSCYPSNGRAPARKGPSKRRATRSSRVPRRSNCATTP